MRRLYGSRREALLEALQKHFGDDPAVEGEDAGMHAFVRLADKGLLERARFERGFAASLADRRSVRAA